MMSHHKSRRAALKTLFGSVLATQLLNGCSSDVNINKAIEALVKTLRHPGVAAHLGRLEVETNSELAPLTAKELAENIMNEIGLDIDSFNEDQISTLKEKLSHKIRDDFSNEAVTTVDGWLLSVTEASVCALVFLQLTQSSA